MDGKGRFLRRKAKVIATIVAIAAIELLKAFVNVSNKAEELNMVLTTTGKAAVVAGWRWTTNDKTLAWKMMIHDILIVFGALFAYMDGLSIHHKDISQTKSGY
ncbi:hypothetical protein [Nitrosomonas communis]|uniref:Uncharacterized protein n=1 Tax=Nitrosomonas communis TaxID=44574 RepID=A0A1I4WAG3_9PROT|nr:hypothetical protein [Nitrosomonas communis]SFN10302.1 hypothetical protein SAMN05421863_11038 [Nitrosomonas communis]